MAVMISQFIRGKHRPGYDRKVYSNPDKCIIVNVDDPLFTKRKRLQKVYRHHTGYPGGLKEQNIKLVVEKNPEKIIINAVMGMLPKNSLRDDIIRKNLTLIRGPYHNFHNVGLPQFTVPLPKDINDYTGTRDINKDNSYIEFMSNPNSIPDELKDLPI